MNPKNRTAVFRISRTALLGLGISGLALAESDIVDIVDKQGRAMKGSFTLSDGATLGFTREPDKKSFSVPVASLNDATQALVQAWIKKGGSQVEKFDVTVDTGKNRRKKGGEDFDDKRINLEPQIIVKNPDSRFVSRKGKLTAIFLGRPVDSNSDLYVLKSSSHELPQIQPLASQVIEIGEISQAYDSCGVAKFGARYLGYVIVIHDEAGGKIYDARSIPAPLLGEHGKRWLTLKTGITYDRNLMSLARDNTLRRD